MKWLLGGFVVVVISLLIAIPFYLGPDDLRGCDIRPDESTTKCAPSDAIIAVSGGDT